MLFKFQLAEEVGILPEELDPYGRKKAKVSLSVLKRLQHVKDGKYICVAGKDLITCGYYLWYW